MRLKCNHCGVKTDMLKLVQIGHREYLLCGNCRDKRSHYEYSNSREHIQELQGPIVGGSNSVPQPI